MKNHFVLYILFLVIVWIPSLATFITAKATLDHTIIYAFCLIKVLFFLFFFQKKEKMNIDHKY